MRRTISLFLGFLLLVQPVFADSVKSTAADTDNKKLISELICADHAKQEQAAAKLLQQGTAATDSLIAVLHDKNPDVRFYAVQLLGKIGDVKSADAIMSLLDDPVGHVSLMAAHALSYNDAIEKKALGKIINLLKQRDGKKNFLGAAAIYKTNNADIFKIILNTDDYLTIINKACNESRSAEARKMLLMFLARMIDINRINSLGHAITDQTIKETLIYALNDKNDQIRRTAVLSLLDDCRSKEDHLRFVKKMAVDPSPVVRAAVAINLTFSNISGAKSILLQLFNDKDKIVSLTAAHALAFDKDYRGYDLALQSLDDNDESVQSAPVSEILQNQESINAINKEARELWSKYMVNLTNVDMLDRSKFDAYTHIALLGESITFFPASNIPAHIEVRASKNRNVRLVFIFKPGTSPQWDKPRSAITIGPNIFVVNSSGNE